jgi:hypothetical protein
MNDPLLTAEKLREAFSLLGSRLRGVGLTADVFIFGGAAMVIGLQGARCSSQNDWRKRTHIAYRKGSRYANHYLTASA